MALPEDQILGKTDKQLMSAESAKHIQQRDHLVFTSMKPAHNEEWVTYNNSRRRLLDMSKVPVFDEFQQLAGILGVGRDITREREAERRIKQASLLFEVSSDPCFIAESSGNLSAANPASLQVLGYEANELIGLPLADFIFPPPQEMSLATILSRKFWKGELIVVHRNGESRPYLVNISSVLGERQEIVSQVITLMDMGDVAGISQSLSHKAYHDPLTGLANRHLMMTRLQHSITQAQRNDDFIAVLFVDIDGFKAINDRYGHQVGDRVLKAVGERLKKPIRDSDTLVRLGGDEFVIILERLQLISGIDPVIKKLLKSVSDAEIHCGDVTVHITISMGVSIFPNHATCPDELVSFADRAMYVAKANGRNQACFFHSSLSRHIDSPE